MRTSILTKAEREQAIAAAESAKYRRLKANGIWGWVYHTLEFIEANLDDDPTRTGASLGLQLADWALDLDCEPDEDDLEPDPVQVEQARRLRRRWLHADDKPRPLTIEFTGTAKPKP